MSSDDINASEQQSSELASLKENLLHDEAIDLPDDIYERIVQQVQSICQSVTEPDETPQAALEKPAKINSDLVNEPEVSSEETQAHFEYQAEPVRPPRAPESLPESGLSLSQLADLILKLIYLNGSGTGFEIAKQLRLPFSVVDEGLAFLKTERAMEVNSGEIAGRLSYQFSLTEQGRKRAREAFEECRYVGPAPVSLADYHQQCLLQSTKKVALTPTDIRNAFQEMIIEESLLKRLGPAVLSGQSIFLFGSPGNGKTMIAKAIGALMNRCGGEIYIPYAVTVDQHIVTVFDPSLHQTIRKDLPPSEAVSVEFETTLISQNEIDARWRRIKRPVVMAGGELSLEMLDLKFHSTSGYYTAPLHMKSNGGVFLLDDFGRQLVPPAELLNRWILPLEEQTDYLTLSTGKKFAIPFEQMILFSTNLLPSELVDDAFLRRIRHKIPISAPSEAQFCEIFRRCCQERGIPYDDWLVSQFVNSHYNQNRPPKSSDPRDLLDIVRSICRFNEQSYHLSEEVLTEAWRECHGDLQTNLTGEED